jgi:hypothetical protein
MKEELTQLRGILKDKEKELNILVAIMNKKKEALIDAEVQTGTSGSIGEKTASDPEVLLKKQRLQNIIKEVESEKPAKNSVSKILNNGTSGMNSFY